MTASLRDVMELASRVEPEVDVYVTTMRASFARRYEEKRDSWTADDAAAEAGRELLSRLARWPGSSSVLDIGTGRGRDLELFLEHGHRATGIDIVAPENWPTLRARWGARVSLHETSLQACGLSERFDAILDNGCFHHQHPDDLAGYVARVHSLLAPEGIALFAVYTPLGSEDDGALLLDRDGRIHRELTLFEMQDALSLGGLVVVDARHVRRAWGGKLLFVVCRRLEDVARRTP